MPKGRVKTTVLFSAALGLAALHVQAGEAPVAADDADFVKLGPPKPGEWRDVFPEPVQTFEEYRERMPKPHYNWRLRISLVPFEGETDVLDEKALQLLREFLGAYFFMLLVELEPVRELPETVRRRAPRGFGTQVLADDVLHFMARDAQRWLLPGEPLEEFPFLFYRASLGIVQTDLYASSPDEGYLNFVFGMGAPKRGIAVISAARYSIHYDGEPEGITPRKRIFKVAAHEIGHVFGLAHCQKYGCCMNGSNSLPEADRRPTHLCPECLEKIEWRLDFDSRERYRALGKLYLKLGWKKEADFAARRATLNPEPPAPAEKDAERADSKGTEQQ